MLKISQLVRLSLFVVALCSSGAGAQTASNFAIALTGSSTQINCTTQTTPITFNVTGQMTFTTTPQTVYVYVYATTAVLSSGQLVCPPNFPPPTNPGAQIGTFAMVTDSSPTISLNQSNFGNPTVASLGLCGASTTVPQNFALCGYILGAVGGQLIDQAGGSGVSTEAVFNSVSTAPASITVESVGAGDGQITFSVSSNQAETGFFVCYASNLTAAPDATALNALVDTNGACTGPGLTEVPIAGSASGSATNMASSGTLTWPGLTNGTHYSFVIQGNVGDKWSAVQADVVPMVRFSTLGEYDGSPGGVSWQCAQTNAPLTGTSLAVLAMLFSAAYFLSPSRRRRSKQLLGKGLLGVMFMLVASGASADAGQFKLGLAATFYKPNLDKGTTSQVYANHYNGAWRPLLGLDFDFHVYDPFGSIQLGFGTAFTWVNGYAATSAGLPYVASSVSESMYLLELTPRITYVFDEFVEDFPIAPYVNGGIVATGYYFTYQGGPDTKGQPRNINPLGVRFGWFVGGGLLFCLDWIEPTVAATARATGTYEHTYIKAGVSYMPINDFGNPGFDFSPAHFGADLPLQLDFALVFEF